MPYDLIVLGAGPGGYVAAIRAAQRGLKTVVIEKAQVGGVCLHIGCIPTKSLIHSANEYAALPRLASFGIGIDYTGFTYAAVAAQAKNASQTLAKGVSYLLHTNGVAVIEDTGKIEGPNTVRLQNGEVLEGKYILIATGSRPRSLPGLMFDGTHVLSSNDMLRADTLPKSICIIGGGAIGCEFAYLLNSFGVDVTLVEMTGQLLPLGDEEVAKALATSFKKKKIAVHLGAKASIRACEANGVTLSIEKEAGETGITAEQVLVVVGRVPNTGDIGLENVEITTEKGFIPVNNHYQTSVPSIFAIGDVINTPMLAHVASKEGEAAVDWMSGQPAHRDFSRFVPSCVYCEPQVAGFGFTQAQAQANIYDCKTLRFQFRGVGKSVAIGKTEGFVKIITDRSGILLGAHIIGTDATEMIHELALAASSGLTVRQIASMVHAHPTLSEAIMECARCFETAAAGA